MCVRRLLLASSICLMAIGAQAGQGWACSVTQPPSVDQIVSDDPFPDARAGSDVVLGVYEYEHIARSSGVFGDRSVTVITRYWGEPPDDLGAKLVRRTCGSWVRDSGSVGYWWIDPFHAERFADWRSSQTLDGTADGLDSSESELLTARFGEPIALGVSPWSRGWAVALAWQWELIVVVLLGSATLLIARRRSSASTRPTAEPAVD